MELKLIWYLGLGRFQSLFGSINHLSLSVIVRFHKKLGQKKTMVVFTKLAWPPAGCTQIAYTKCQCTPDTVFTVTNTSEKLTAAAIQWLLL